MKGKVIAVIGNNATGKSTLSGVLAQTLTKTKEQVIIVSYDSCTPMLPIWSLEKNIPRKHSIGNFSSMLDKDIIPQSIGEKVIVSSNNANIGYMGYAAGETPMSYQILNIAKWSNIFDAVSNIADFTILDCPSEANQFTIAALQEADIVIQLVSPDLKGEAYYFAHKTLKNQMTGLAEKTITCASILKPFAPVNEVDKLIDNGFFASFPYVRGIDETVTSGDMALAYKQISLSYKKNLEKIINHIRQDNTDDDTVVLQ